MVDATDFSKRSVSFITPSPLFFRLAVLPPSTASSSCSLTCSGRGKSQGHLLQLSNTLLFGHSAVMVPHSRRRMSHPAWTVTRKGFWADLRSEIGVTFSSSFYQGSSVDLYLLSLGFGSSMSDGLHVPSVYRSFLPKVSVPDAIHWKPLIAMILTRHCSATCHSHFYRTSRAVQSPVSGDGGCMGCFDTG